MVPLLPQEKANDRTTYKILIFITLYRRKNFTHGVNFTAKQFHFCVSKNFTRNRYKQIIKPRLGKGAVFNLFI